MDNYTTDEEVWKDIIDYEGIYQISNKGRVKSLKRRYVKEDKILDGSLTADGYRQVMLRREGKVESRHINSILAEHFQECKNEPYLKTNCATCGNEIVRKSSEVKRNITGYFFCSSSCDAVFRSEKMLNKSLKLITSRIGAVNFRDWIYNQYVVEKKSSIEISQMLYGKKRNEGAVLSWLRRFDIQVRDNKIEAGSKHWKYNANKTDEERVLNRRYPEYRVWRSSVFERDNYTCNNCGKVGGRLNAHHLEGYDKNKNLRLDISNGVTMCERCHKDFHDMFGRGNNNTKQYRQFIMNK